MQKPPLYSSNSATSKSENEQKKKRRLKFSRRKNKKKIDKKYEIIIDAVPVNETSSLMINATHQDPPRAILHLEQAKKILYSSHFVAKFSELGWQFCLILFLTALTNYKSLALVSTYGLFTGLVSCLAGPSAGALVDSNHDRLIIAQVFIWVQNLSVIIATTCCFFLLRLVPAIHEGGIGLNSHNQSVPSLIFPELAPPATYKTWVLIIAVHIFGAIGKLTDQSMTVAMERDWIVVMSKVAGKDYYDDDDEEDESFGNLISPTRSQSDMSSVSIGNASLGSNVELNDEIIRKLKEKSWLSQTNTSMKQIDLICKVAAPAAAGIFFAYFDNHKLGEETIEDSHWYNLSYAALIIGGLNLISLLVEYSCIQKIYDKIPSLAMRKYNASANKSKSSRFNHSGNDKDNSENEDIIWTSNNQGKSKDSCRPFALPRGLEIYLRQPIFFGGFALSLLYLNVLTFGALMTAYLVWRGMSYESIGTLRGVSSIIGLLGTVIFHFSSRRYSLSFTGTWSIMFQFTCLSLCYGSLYVSNQTVSLIMLILGVIASRIGLYVFDLTITQLMQIMIPEDIRGVIGGVQKSLNGFFDLTTYGLGLIFADPSDFSILVATGFASVGISMCLYIWGMNHYQDAIQALSD